MEVDIDWPHQVGNDKPLGKWLLYLEDLPVIEATGGGDCSVVGRAVNPLNLKNKEQASSFMAPALTQDPALMRRINKSHLFAMEYRGKSPSSSAEEKKSETEDKTVVNRVRRDHSMIIRAEKLTDKDGKKTNIVSMVKVVRTSIEHIFKLKLSIPGLREENCEMRENFLQNLQLRT